MQLFLVCNSFCSWQNDLLCIFFVRADCPYNLLSKTNVRKLQNNGSTTLRCFLKEKSMLLQIAYTQTFFEFAQQSGARYFCIYIRRSSGNTNREKTACKYFFLVLRTSTSAYTTVVNTF